MTYLLLFLIKFIVIQINLNLRIFSSTPMLTSCLQDPFKHVLHSLKAIHNSNPVIQHKDLNMIMKDLHRICILNNLLIRLIDHDHYRKLCEGYQILALEIDPKQASNLLISNQDSFPQNILKSQQDLKLIGFQKIVKRDMTPSTKKSRAIATPNIAILVQDLIESIQKFESIEQNLQQLASLIQGFHKKLQILSQNDEFDHYNGNFQRLYYFVEKKINERNNICRKKNVEILQIHKLIKEFVEFMNNVVSSSNQIQEVIKSQSPYSQGSQQILQGLSINQNYSKRSNDAGSKKSLLTQMLRDSSQKSNFQGQNQFPARQLCLRPGTKQYSQKQNNQMVIDPSYRISLIKTQKPRFNSQKLLKSQMECIIQGIDQQRRKKAEIHAKKNGIGCSNCQIF